MQNWTEAESKIDQIASEMSKKGKNIPAKVEDIPGIGFASYFALRSAIPLGVTVLQKFSFEWDSNIVSMFSTQTERLRLSLYGIGIWLVPIIALGLGAAFSWWCLLMIAASPMLSSRFKKLYRGVIFRAALGSEKAFCFLYYTGEICLTSPASSESTYWGKDEED